MKIALFPGTFNPIHIAHLIIAEQARDQLGLDKVLLIPSNIPPHREGNIASAYHRLEMVKKVCLEHKYFEASDIEVKRNGPSYTFDTISELHLNYPNCETLYMIIGADALNQLHTWNNCQGIVDTVTFLILSRPGSPDISNCVTNTGLKNFKYEIIQAPQLQISSTLIRDKIAVGRSIKFLVLDSVMEYIDNNELYR